MTIFIMIFFTTLSKRKPVVLTIRMNYESSRKIIENKYIQTTNLNNNNTIQIADELQQKGIDVLVLEDLRSLRKSASKKLGSSKGKMINYIINLMPYGMFQKFLKYKCLDRGIRVETINPTNTSKTCSRYGSINYFDHKGMRFSRVKLIKYHLNLPNNP